MRYLPALILTAAACTQGEAPAAEKSARTLVTPTVSSASSTPAVASIGDLQSGTDPIVRGLYVNRFASQSTKRMKSLIGVADSTEINALVIDVKDEFGLNFHSSDPVVSRNEGTAPKVANMRALLDTIRAHGILPIARIVVFKDSVTARLNPGNTIRKPDGTPWRDKKGLMWVNPYANPIWEYNFRVAEEAVRLGFGEVQFDYIRFPEPYKSLPPQVFPEQKGRTKTAALAEFLQTANRRLDKLGVRTTADIFGLVTTVGGALEVGQAWEPLAKSVDVLLPMTYPSHYPHGSFGIPLPNAEPYKIQYTAIARARQRNDAIGVKGERVRPWIQAFSLGPPAYGAREIEAQKKGIYDAGYDGWILWHPGSRYEAFLGGLEKTLVTRKKSSASPPSAPSGQ
jgi:hypothetical protein